MPSPLPTLQDGSLSTEYEVLQNTNTGLGELFCMQARSCPYATAVIYGELVLSYGQLHSKAKCLANRLRQLDGFRSEAPTAILVAPGPNDVIAQIAVLYAGGTCVPLSPSLPDHQADSRLADVGSHHLIVDAENGNRLATPYRVCIENEIAASAVIQHTYHVAVSTTLGHRTHLLFTSGTSGKPKAVQILARSILQLVYHSPFSPLNSQDRVAKVNDTSFDVSLYEIWIPLLRGASIVVLDRNVLFHPLVLAKSIDCYKLTVLVITTAVLNLTAAACPWAFSRLRMLLCGGEMANKKAIQTILESAPPQQLINCYGPTECCLYCLVHRVTLDDCRMDGPVSIGKPIGKTTVYILDECFLPVEDEQVGELFIGGPGVSSGYFNRESQNVSSFVELVGLAKRGVPVRLYRTGDLVRRRKSGLVDFIGRRDNQVKIRGYRIELEAVEAALLKTGCFLQAVALKIDSPREGAGSILVAFAMPISPENGQQHHIIEILKSLLPNYMMPRIQHIKEFPLNSRGKVDRQKLRDMILNQWHLRSNSIYSGSMDTIARLEHIWLNILALPQLQINPGEDFYLLGGTSLQAAVLIHQIRQDFGIEISTLSLHDNSSLSSLANFINTSKDSRPLLKDHRNDWLADSRLAEGLVLTAGRLREWRADTEGHVFLTGATGFVGAHFLWQLLKMSEVRQVGCLVRAPDAASGLLRIRESLQKYGIWEESMSSMLMVLPGRLEDETLGLGQECFAKVADWASVVFHLGGHVNYSQPYSTHRPANVLGTLNVLRLAIMGRPKALHYMSTISAFGPTGMVTGVSRILEDESLLAHLDALPYDHGYAQSQWVADRMLQITIDKGFPVAIYRPGFITGPNTSGLSNPDDFFNRLMTSCLQMGCYPILPNQRKEFITVDYANSALLHIASSNRNLGHAFHLVPQDRSASVDMIETFEMLRRLGFPNLHGLPYDEWVRRLMKDTPKRLKPLVPMLREKVYKDLTRWELYENMPVYETTNTIRALAGQYNTISCPPLDENLMKLYLRQWTCSEPFASRPVYKPDQAETTSLAV